jgi:D-aminoacyl-tRNA deacylase
MIALIQRVSQALVRVDEQVVGEIGRGLLALVAVEPGDGEVQASRMAERLLGYRVFEDAGGRMNRSLTDTGGDLLLVSQFTLAADTSRGMRPGFSTAAEPAQAERWFDRLVELCRASHCRQDQAPVHHGRVEKGRFGAHMQVALVNDGPVTFLLRA